MPQRTGLGLLSSTRPFQFMSELRKIDVSYQIDGIIPHLDQPKCIRIYPTLVGGVESGEGGAVFGTSGGCVQR